MSERDFAMALALLAEAMGEQKLTPVRIEAYHRGLKDIPLPLLQATVDRLIATVGSESFRWTALPAVADIRKAAERMRLELRKQHPFESCGCCSEQGWTWVEIEGVKRMTKCRCVHAHVQRLATMGLETSYAALPPGGAGDGAGVRTRTEPRSASASAVGSGPSDCELERNGLAMATGPDRQSPETGDA